jgi:hypothetical protein
MKKTKRQPEAKPEVKAVPQPGIAWLPGGVWWPWAAGIAGLIVVFQIYAPALNAAFVLDDRYLPYFSAHTSDRFSDWVGLVRPLLMASYWINYAIAGGSEPFGFHVTNVLIHFMTAVMAGLIVAKLVEWAGVTGRMRAALGVISCALFLVHPLQVEAVAYTSGRSDALSTLFYYAAFTVFLYRRKESIGLLEAFGVLVLFGAAIGSKENTLTLPALLLLTDYFWGRGSLMKNRILYGLLAIAGAIGAKMVWNIIRNQQTAGFKTEGMTPVTFFFTECRVTWTYIRMFFLPFGQNVDPDVPISQTVIDHGAIVGLIALVGLMGAAWIYRKQFPLAAFGVFVFLLLSAPTSSFVPIKDVMSERRVYLPMIGLLLICCEVLRRLTYSRVVQIGAIALVVCSVLTYKRSEIWASPLTLWTDAVSKSPNKYRPQFQLGFAQFERAQCPAAVRSFEAASRLQAADNELLVDWALALDCAGRQAEAIDKLKQALQFGETAHIHTQIARVYMRQQQWQGALAELARAQQLDPNYDMTYLYRGNIYQISGDRQAAAREIQRALQLNPDNQVARQALAELAK